MWGFCYGIYPVEGIGVFRVPKNRDARNKKPPALRVETKRCTKKTPFRYNRVVQALQEEYYVSTVGLNEATIKKSIQDQEKYDIMQDKLSVKEYENPFKG